MKTITVFRIKAGSITRMYATEHHAEQMARALRLNGLEPLIDVVRLPNDPLTRLTVQGLQA